MAAGSSVARYPVTVQAPKLSDASVSVRKSDDSTTATAFAAATGSSTVSLPISVSADSSTTFYLPEDVFYISAEVSSTEMAGGPGSRKRIVANGPNTIVLEHNPAGGGGGGGTTNLAYTTGASSGVVTSDTGTDATIPAATSTDAGLLSAADKAVLDRASVAAKLYLANNYS